LNFRETRLLGSAHARAKGSCAVIGLHGDTIEVAVDISNKRLPAFNAVGLPDTTVQEARPPSGPWWGLVCLSESARGLAASSCIYVYRVLGGNVPPRLL
jgi:hypothetical protein